MTKFYTGVGSRDLPNNIKQLMVKLGIELAERGYTLRSGRAGGADLAFQEGCYIANGKAEIYTPWSGFNKEESAPFGGEFIKFYTPNESSFNKAREYLLDKEIITWFDKMKQGAQKLHCRNYYQVKGKDNILSEICFYYCKETKSGEPTGGTRTAVKICDEEGVKSFNLLHYNPWEKLEAILNDLDKQK